jgi:hypothetical protein
LTGVVDDGRGEERQPEVRHPLKVALELGLVAHAPDQDRVPAAVGEAHPGKGLTCAMAELALDGEPPFPSVHAAEHRAVIRRSLRGDLRSPG